MSALAGRRILVTRPAGQADELARLIREAGGEALLVPVIEIQDVEEVRGLSTVADGLDGFQLAIFVSRSAVQRGLDLLGAHGVRMPWTGPPRVAALGQGSRRALRERGFGEVIAPAGLPDSEALLALPELSQVEGRRVAIFRGEGGREVLGKTLAERGALVTAVACYRRVLPEASRAPLGAALARGADAIAVTSVEGLANLFELAGAGHAARIAGAPLFVPHPRVQREAQRRGVRSAIVAGPGDAEMLAALVAYFGAAS